MPCFFIPHEEVHGSGMGRTSSGGATLKGSADKKGIFKGVFWRVFLLVFLMGLFVCSPLWAASEVIPPVPTSYVVDEAGILQSATRNSLNASLEDFERKTSNQVVVAIYPKMLSDSSMEDYTVRVAQKWGVGQKKNDNGAVLFVFVQDRKLYIQVGYGLEGALPDLLCSQIIQNEMVPYFKQGQMEKGIVRGVQAILQASQGEYKGNGKTVGEQKNNDAGDTVRWILLVIFLLILIFSNFLKRNSMLYSSSGLSTGGWGWGGGSSGGWSGGGGFGGGGGSFGGGGSGGSW